MTPSDAGVPVQVEVKLAFSSSGAVHSSLRCTPLFAYATTSQDLSYYHDDDCEQPLTPSLLYNDSPSSSRPMSPPRSAPSKPQPSPVHPASVVSSLLPSFPSLQPATLIALGKALPSSHPLLSASLTSNLARLLPFTEACPTLSSSSPWLPVDEAVTLSTACEPAASLSAVFSSFEPMGPVKLSLPSVTLSGEVHPLTLSGAASLEWADGSDYDGDVEGGVRHGHGVYRSPVRALAYQGHWLHGLRHGHGKLSYDRSGQTYYVGQWQRGRRHGRGTMRWASGNVYEGEWADDRKHGQGCMRWHSHAQTYTGQWADDVPHGEGRYVWTTPAQISAAGPVPRLSLHHPLYNAYAGGVVRGVREGEGSFFYADGSEWHGSWRAGRKHGAGVWVWDNGAELRATWADDDIVEDAQRRHWAEQTTHTLSIHLPTSNAADTAALTTLLQRFDTDLRRVYRLLCLVDTTGELSEREGFGVRLTFLQLWEGLRRFGLIDAAPTDEETEGAPTTRTAADVDRAFFALHQRRSGPGGERRRVVDYDSIHDERHVLLYREFVELLVALAVDPDTDVPLSAQVERLFALVSAEAPGSSLDAFVPALFHQHPRFAAAVQAHRPALDALWLRLSTPSLASRLTVSRYGDRTMTMQRLLAHLQDHEPAVFDAHFTSHHALRGLSPSPASSSLLTALHAERTQREFLDLLVTLALYRHQVLHEQGGLREVRRTEREDRERVQEERRTKAREERTRAAELLTARLAEAELEKEREALRTRDGKRHTLSKPSSSAGKRPPTTPKAKARTGKKGKGDEDGMADCPPALTGEEEDNVQRAMDALLEDVMETLAEATPVFPTCWAAAAAAEVVATESDVAEMAASVEAFLAVVG